MSDQNREFQNQNGGYPYYGQNPYYQAPMPYYQAPPAAPGQQMPPQGGQMPYGQPQYYQAPPAAPGQQMPPQGGQMPYGQPQYYQAPPAAPGQPPMPPQGGQMPYGQPQQYYQAPPVAYGQPQYYQAPPAAPAPAEPAPAEPAPAEGEVILQKSMFEDYGFSSDDSLNSGHDFGGLMRDNNEPETNFFNSPTPNLDISEVEKSAADSNTDSAIFTAPTPNLDISSVEAAANVVSDSDREIFSNTVPIMPADEPIVTEPVTVAPPEPIAVAEPPVAAEPAAAPAAPAMDFMASMQNMFSSMAKPAEAPVAPVPVQEPAEAPAPMPEAVPMAQPDIIVKGPAEQNAPAAENTIHDISSTSQEKPEEEKGPEYWAYMNQLLNQFDDGQVHADVSQPVYEVHTPAPAVPAPTPTPVVPTPAPAVQPAPEANPVPKGIVINDVSRPAPEVAPVPVASEPDSEPAAWLAPDDKALKAEAKAAKAQEKAAAKAAKAEQKAAAKAAKAEQKKAKQAQKAAAEDESFTDNFEDKEETRETSKFKRFLASVFPVKGDTTAEIIRKVIALVAAVVFIVCMVILGNMYLGTKANEKDTSELSNLMASGETSGSDWSSIYAKYPDIQFPTGMQTKFADIYALNQDLIGWIRIAGLNIDFPVVQTDNDKYYLKHDFKGNKSDYGTVFISSKNNVSELDLNTVVYGHSMRRDTQMFTALKEYKTVEGFKKNPVIEFNTLYKDYKFKVYAVFISNGSTAGDNGYVFPYTFENLPDVQSFAGFVDQINQRTLYKTGVDIKPNDKLITLSTCTYEFDNARLVVVGRLVRDGESEEVDVSKVVVNSNPRYPQAWYDANKKTNPYANYDRWVPSK